MDKIIKRLLESHKRRLNENASELNEYKDKIEKILNHELGSYESSIDVEDLEIVSQTTETITFKVEYAVAIQIPMQDNEDGNIYIESDTEFRTRTMSIDRKDL